MAESNNLLKEKAQLIEKIKRLQSEFGKEAAKSTDAYINTKGRLEEIVKILKQFKTTQSSIVQEAVDLESAGKSLGTIYSDIGSKMRQQAVVQSDIAAGIANELNNEKALVTSKGNQQQIVAGLLEKYNKQMSLASKLAQMDADDVVAKRQVKDEISSIGSQIENEVGLLDRRTNIAKQFLTQQDGIAASVNEQIASAEELSSLTKDQKDILEEQAAVFESMKKKVNALGSTLTTFLSRPQAAIGALVIGIGKFAGKFGEVNRELGQSFTQGLNKSTMSATALGFIFDDTAGTVRELASEFGGVDAATLGTQANIGLMATNMGISNKEAVSLTASFARMNGGSTDIAADMVKTTQEFASQNGIIPAALMQDLAGATEEFALFGKDGGKNILEAAGYAQKLGVNMKTLSGVADNLLDFETSITKELELGAMLGRDINLDRARALAFEGDIKGATEETLRALGGIESFNRMDYFQKKQTADLLGVSVAELQKMADNQGKAATMGDVVNAKFSKMGEIINGGLNKWLGTGLQGLGGMITMAGQLGTGFSAMGIDVGKIAGNIADGAKNLMSKGWQLLTGGGGGGVAGTVTESVADKAKDSISEKAGDALGGGAPGGGIMDSISKIDMNAVLKGAAAMVIVAGAVFVFGKAVQEFMKVSWEAVGMAVVSMLALVGAVALLGAIMTSGVGAVAILAGAAAMLVIAASVLVLGVALQSIGTGFEMMANGIGTLMPQLMSVAATIGGLVVLIPAIALLSYSIMGLSASLVALGLAGIVAAPGLMALGAVGAITQGLNSLFGGGDEEGAGGGEGEDKSQLLIDEIKGLRSDLLSGKIGVYMDGEKVTSRVAAAVERVGGNSYAMS